jgi:hypothetical protein
MDDTWTDYLARELPGVCEDVGVWGSTRVTQLLAAAVHHLHTPECVEAMTAAGRETWPAFLALLAKRMHAAVSVAVVPPGEPVGPLAIQAIAHPIMQQMLNTFHLAGAGNSVSSGMVRVTELIGAQTNIATPRSVLPVRQGREARAARAAARAPRLMLRDAVSLAEIIREWPVHTEDDAAASVDAELMTSIVRTHGGEALGVGSARPPSSYVARYILRRDALASRGVFPMTVARALQRFLGRVTSASVVASLPHAREWVVRVRFLRDHSREVAQAHIKGAMRSLRVAGMPSVRGCTVQNGALVADGPCFASWAGHPDIDWLRATTCHVLEAYTSLGIIAAQGVLLDELAAVLTPQQLDPRHLLHLVLTMTHDGVVAAVSRQGFPQGDDNVMCRACFEQTEVVLRDAALFGQSDMLSTPPACIAVGVRVPAGSGLVGVEYPPYAPQHAARDGETVAVVDVRPPRRSDALSQARRVAQQVREGAPPLPPVPETEAAPLTLADAGAILDAGGVGCVNTSVLPVQAAVQVW